MSDNPMHDHVVIVGAARTPIGSFQGQFAALPAPQLGAVAIEAAVRQAGVRPEAVEELLMGCVLPAGVGQAPARQAAIRGGLPLSTTCTTISKVCGSGMKAIMLAHDLIKADSQQLIVAGGMESMTNAPYLLPRARGGYRLGHGTVTDHMFFDGLEDRYAETTNGRLMGTFAEDCAREFSFLREDQDAYARTSTLRAQEAASAGHFDWEIAPVALSRKGGETLIAKDEGPGLVRLDKIPTLKPAFSKDGTVTAANSSSISDGAAAVLLTRASVAARQNLQTLAVVRGHATHAQEPARFTTAPVGAIQKLLQQVHWKVSDVDLWEINEAFAVVPMAAMRELSIPHEQVNIHGGACSLGHPIGASGARILVTLLGALRQRNLRRGIATLCIGGGEATAIAVELLK